VMMESQGSLDFASNKGAAGIVEVRPI
jgi:hypothetical protein